MEQLSCAVLGATGYTGVELLRLLVQHPRMRVAGVYGQSTAGKSVGEVLPSLAGTGGFLGTVLPFEVGASDCPFDVAFCALPHGASAPAVAYLREKGIRVFDLSADFRLRSREVFQSWYGEHGATELFGTAPYGLVELHRKELVGAELVAVPGCYPTASILALAPLLSERLIEGAPVVIDAKSGVSGAGRKASLGTHFCEVGEGVRAYNSAGRHRHTPEIEQELSLIAGEPLSVTFTPHLVPMSRGLLATAYGVGVSGTTADRCSAAAKTLYADSPSVVVLPDGAHPDTAAVRGSNRALLSYTVDERTGMVVAQCAIDNLVKGAAGQAIQCLNVSLGWEETTGLGALSVWP